MTTTDATPPVALAGGEPLLNEWPDLPPLVPPIAPNTNTAPTDDADPVAEAAQVDAAVRGRFLRPLVDRVLIPIWTRALAPLLTTAASWLLLPAVVLSLTDPRWWWAAVPLLTLTVLARISRRALIKSRRATHLTLKAFRARLMYALTASELVPWAKLTPGQIFRSVKISSPVRDVYRVDFRTPRGQRDEAVLEAANKQIAPVLGTNFVVPLPGTGQAGNLSVAFAMADKLAMDLPPETTPALHLTEDDRNDPYLRLPIGVDILERPVECQLYNRGYGAIHLLQGGATGSGKSALLRQIAYFAAVNANIDLIFIDGKGAEFSYIEPFAAYYGTSAEDALAVLRFLDREIQERSRILGAHKAEAAAQDRPRWGDNWNIYDDGAAALAAGHIGEFIALPGSAAIEDGQALRTEDIAGLVRGARNHLTVIIEEYAFIVSHMDPRSRERAEFDQLLAGVLKAARSVGIQMLLSAQDFKADVISTTTRGQFACFIAGSYKDAYTPTNVMEFDPDGVSPINIGGSMTKDGGFTTSGQFAIKGYGDTTYGKSYYLNDKTSRKALAPFPHAVKYDLIV